MTSQMCDFFEYDGEPCCLVGYTGGSLPSAEDFGMHFYPGSTADARGYCMVYGIDDANKLVVKKIEVRGEEKTPVSHDRKMLDTGHGLYYDNLNQIIPLTGYMLFSTVWDFRHLLTNNVYPLYEVHINAGHAISVYEIYAEVRRNMVGPDMHQADLVWQGNTSRERLDHLARVWDFTATILPRRYDSLYLGIWYLDFQKWIDELKSVTS